MMLLISVQRDGLVRNIILNRPEKRNALNEKMVLQVRELLQAEPPGDERVTTIRGNGPSFCAGLELVTSGVEPKAASLIESMFDAVQRYPLPVVAQVENPKPHFKGE